MALNIKPLGDRGLMLPSRQRLGVRQSSGAFPAPVESGRGLPHSKTSRIFGRGFRFGR